MKNLFLILTIFFFILQGCKKEEPESSPTTPSSSFEVIQISQGDVVNYVNGNVTVANPAEYNVGDVIVSGFSEQAQKGFLRKITSKSGNTLMTSQPSLEEVVQNGSLSFSHILKPSKGFEKLLPKGVTLTNPKDFDFGFDLEDFEVCEGIFINGYIHFNYTPEGEIQISNWKLKKFLFTNKISQESSINVSCNGSYSLQEKEQIIWTQTLPGFLAGTLGIVPIYVTPSLDVVIKSDGSFQICTSTVGQTVACEGGIVYENNNWSLIKTFNSDFSNLIPTLQANLSLEVYAGINLNLFIYDLAGPYANLDAGLKFTASNKTIYWDLSGLLNLNAGAKVQILSKTLVDKDFQLIFYEESLASGEISGGTNTPPVANFTMDPPSSQTLPITVNFDASSSHDSQDPLSSLFFRWDLTGDGVWDTDWSHSHTASKYYTEQGIVQIKLQVKDSGEEISECSKELSLVVEVMGEPCPGIPTVTYGGKIYNTVQIGNQCWMKENLDYAASGAVYYNEDIANQEYGRLYPWDEISDEICPYGWHLPLEAEWESLLDYLGGDAIAGGPLKETGFVHWNSPNTGATNSSGFTAYGGGCYDAGVFKELKERGYFAVSQEGGQTWASIGLRFNWDNVSWDGFGAGEKVSVRCIKN